MLPTARALQRSGLRRRRPPPTAAYGTLCPPAGFVAFPGMENGSVSRVLFFTGKGGVGKTALSCATSLALADSGKSVLLVSTDPASNLDEMLQTPLKNSPIKVNDTRSLFAMNINPHDAAEEYRARVLQPLIDSGTEKHEIDKIREQLSGACTTEVATFDEFSRLLTESYDHIIFDTAPTGHTLRLLSLPLAWTGFLGSRERAATASCLGPHSGLASQREVFKSALSSLQDPNHSTVVLVARPDRGSLNEAARTYRELVSLQILHQHLAINGVFRAVSSSDPVAVAYEKCRDRALRNIPSDLVSLPAWKIPLRPYNMVGTKSLRALLKQDQPSVTTRDEVPKADQTTESYRSVEKDKTLKKLVDDLLADRSSGLLLFMGKGGVGKTTIAAAVAVELARRGFPVTLTTTDPAAHLASTLEVGENESITQNLTISRIDPIMEVQRYTEKVIASKGATSDEARDLLIEDLKSPCTEEVAVFHAFAKLVSKSASQKRGFVVLDTAPTGHTLLLLDATGLYHRDVVRSFPEESVASGKVVTPLLRLRDPKLTSVFIVCLPEQTPITEAMTLQDDLRRAGIEPRGWIINNGLFGKHTVDPVLSARIDAEEMQVGRVLQASSGKMAIVPWQPEEPVGVAGLQRIIE